MALKLYSSYTKVYELSSVVSKTANDMHATRRARAIQMRCVLEMCRGDESW